MRIFYGNVIVFVRFGIKEVFNMLYGNVESIIWYVGEVDLELFGFGVMIWWFGWDVEFDIVYYFFL